MNIRSYINILCNSGKHRYPKLHKYVMAIRGNHGYSKLHKYFMAIRGKHGYSKLHKYFMAIRGTMDIRSYIKCLCNSGETRISEVT